MLPQITSRVQLRAMFALAGPLVLTELGWMTMGVVDTMFVGRVGASAIGAVSLGTNVFYTIAIFAGGLLLGMDTFVAQAWGAGDHEDCRRSFASGVWLSLMLIPPVMGGVWLCIPALSLLGMNAEVLRQAIPYIHALIWSAPPLLVYFALRRYAQAIGLTKSILTISIVANLLNIAGNWIFVYGNLGAPRLGAAGAGWSTCIARVYMVAALGLVIARGDDSLTHARWKIDFKRIGALLKLGMPAAGQIGLETLVFAAVTMLIGKLSVTALAGHQIALTTVSTTFMMPLGISSAAAVLVGQGIGRRQMREAARSGWAALSLGAIVMLGAALMLLIFPTLIARLFTPDKAVIAAAVPLLRIAAIFQLFDGLQITATGALRGAGDTRTPLLCHFAGYWLIGLPLGAALCFAGNYGAVGLWAGLSTGLIIIGTVLLLFWRRTAKRLI